MKKVFCVIFTIVFIFNFKIVYANEINENEDSSFDATSLIVETENIEEIKKDDNIENIVGITENMYAINYKDEECAKDSLKYLQDQDYVDNVLPDVKVSILNNDIEMCKVSSNCLAWGVEYTGMDHYTDYLNYKDNKEVRVAVLDTGINFNHEVFVDAYNINRICTDCSYNYVSKNHDVTDDKGHGTMVSSIIVESTPSNVKVVPIKVLNSNGEGSLIDIVSAISDLKGKVDIINLSLGVSRSKIKQEIFDEYENVFKELSSDEKSPIIVCATGNDSKNGIIEPVCYPASSSYTIAVSALTQNSDRTLEIANYSNCGSQVDFSAPGTDLILANYQNQIGYVRGSGTSFATPFVSSALALIKTEYPDYSKDMLVENLKNNVEDLGSLGKDNCYGYGCINFAKNYFEKPVVAKFQKNKVSSTKCNINLNVVCDDKIVKYAHLKGTDKINSSDWIQLPSSSTNLPLNFDVTENGTYYVYFMDDEEHIGKYEFNVTEIEKVQQILVENIKLNKTSLNLNVGDTSTLVATVTPNNATNKTVNWSSSNTSVAVVDQKGKITTKGAGTTTITAQLEGKKATCIVKVNYKIPSVLYRTHVQDIGWQNYVKNGEIAGTSGRGLRLEGINIKLENNSLNGNIEYCTHVQNIGWQNYVKNGTMSGTSGKGLRLEAIKIRLTGELAKQYDIYYRVHCQNFGWMGWAKNGAESGSAGYGYRLEAIEIKLVEKNGKAPGSTANSYRQNFITYQTHVQNLGWQGLVNVGEMSGTSGQSLRLEGIKINLNNLGISGNIEYCTHVQNIGWQNYVKNGAMSGTSGKALRLEAIKIRLTGDLAKKYDIYYRVHCQNFGWMGWAKNGAQSGSAGYGYRLEGIEIVLVEKGGKAPGNTANSFRQR